MSVKIGTLTFEGPYQNTSKIEDKSGVYVILCRKNGELTVIDVGESATVRTRLDTHDRADCWRRNCSGTIEYCVYYTANQQQSGRMEIEQDLRAKYKPPCGKR